MKSSTTAALALGGAVVLALIALAGTAKAAPKTARIEPHCQYRWVWVIRPPLRAADLQGAISAVNNAPGVRNVEASSTTQETRLTIDVLSLDAPARNVTPGLDTLSLGPVTMTLASVSRIDCE